MLALLLTFSLPAPIILDHLTPPVRIPRASTYAPHPGRIGKRITIRIEVHSEDDDFAVVQGDAPGGGLWTVKYREGCESDQDDVVIEGRLVSIKHHAGSWIDGQWIPAWNEYVVTDATPIK